jgi:hypothetical protein
MAFFLDKIKAFWISAYISFFMGMKRFEDELKADPIDLFKTEQRVEIRSRISMDMFDEVYVQQFYEILKKADKFLRSANPAKIERTAGKFGLNYGRKDQYGRRHEHYGFFDEKHKYYGKSINEVRESEVKERSIDEDDFPVIVMYHNKKEFSFNESAAMIMDHDIGFYAPEIHELARAKKYPLTIYRKPDKNGEVKPVANRIEQLCEFLHVKKISSEHKILEFFIPNKFGVEKITEDDPIFKELIDIDSVWFKDEYGDRNAYNISGFYKRGTYNKFTPKGELNPSGFDIIKFKATDIEQLTPY